MKISLFFTKIVRRNEKHGKKKEIIICFFCFSLFAFSNRADAISNNIFTGDGSNNNPFIIDSVEKWLFLGEQIEKGKDFKDCFFVQTKDIDFSTCKNLQPIGNIEKGTSFSGSYNGNGYVLKNIKMSLGNTGALFENMNGYINNVGIESGKITAKRAGSIVYSGNGHIYNSYNKASVSGKETASGIADNFDGIISNCVNLGIISANKKAGICSGRAYVRYGYSYESIVSDGFEGDEAECGIISKDVLIDKLADILNLNSCIGAVKGDFSCSIAITWINSQGGLFFVPEKRTFFQGGGTVENPYMISNQDELDLLSGMVNSGIQFSGIYFRQNQDISEFEKESWKPIGWGSENVFDGIYDGNGCTLNLSGIQMLFGNVSGRIMNVGIIADDSFGNGRISQNVTETGMLLNCWLDACQGDTLAGVCNGKKVNCVILENGSIKEKIQVLNSNLKDLVIQCGMHCDSLYLWAEGENNKIVYGKRYSLEQFKMDTAPLKGAGTKGDPFLIESVENLICLREKIYEGEAFSYLYVSQTRNLDLSICDIWLPIAEVNTGNSFAGIYDGQGNTIIGLKLRDAENQALFGVVNGTVQNIGLYVNGYGGKNSASITCRLEKAGKIINSYTNYQISNQGMFGEIAYLNEGLVMNCYALSQQNSDFARICVIGKGEIRDSFTEHIYNDEDLFEGEVVNVGLGEKSSWEVLLNDNLIETVYHAGVDIDYIKMWEKSDGISHGATWNWNLKHIMRFLSYNFKKHVLASAVLAILFLWLIVGIARLVFLKKENKIKILVLSYLNKSKVMRQWSIIFGIIVLFWDACIWRKGVHLFTINQWLFTAAIHILFIFAVAKGGKYDFAKMKLYLSNNKGLVIGLAIVSVIDLLHFWIFPIYDSNLYYGALVNAVSNFKFSFSSFLSAFIIWGKPMQGVGLVASIGEFLIPGTAIGVYLINLLLLLAALICFHSMLGDLFHNLNKANKVLLTLCFGFSSFILVGATYISPDFYAAMFFVYIIYSYLKRDYVLFGFWGGILVFTKTNMVVSYLAILLIIFFLDVYSKRRSAKDAILGTLKRRPWFYWTISIYAVVLIYYMIIPLNDYSLHARTALSLAENTQERLLQFMVYDFRWLLFLFIGYTICKLLKQRRSYSLRLGKRKINHIVVSWGMTVGTICQLLILCIVPLGLSPRYFAICMSWYVFTLGWCLNLNIYQKISRSVVLVISTFILFTQLFVTVDPAVMKICQSEVVGNKKVYGLDSNRRKNPLSDIYIENYGYLIYGTLMDEALQKLELKADTRLEFVNGNPLDLGVANHPLYPVYWDKKAERRVFAPNENTLALSFRMLGEKKTKDEVYLINLAPETITQKGDLERQGYYVSKEVKVENRNIAMVCYHMIKRL